jgi:hypothetical protein
MWAIYWKRLPITQGLILAVCALLKFYYGRPWGQVAVFFLFLQFAGLLGVWWGARLRRQIQGSEQRLPLDKG